MANPAVPGFVPAGALTGNEVVEVGTIGPQSARTTTSAIAASALLSPNGTPVGLVGASITGASVRASAAQLTGKPLNRSVAILGDSRTFQCSSIVSPEYSKFAQGWIGWAQFLCRQCFDFDPNDNYGVSNDTTAQMLARTPGMLAVTSAGTIIVLGSTNDQSAGVAYSVTVTNLTQIRDLCLAAGKIVIFLDEMPRGDSTNTGMRLTGANLQAHLRVRQWFIDQRTVPGVYVVDLWGNLADPASTTGDFISVNVSKDGLHENPYGAYLMAVSMQSTMQALFPPVDLLPYTNTDQYDATFAPTGCLNANPTMQGTAGTINSGASGSLADSYSENASPTWTRTYSKVTSNGKGFQQIVLGGTGTTGGLSVREVITAGNLSVGDKVYAVADVEIDASASNVSQLALQLLDNNTITAGDFRRVLTSEVFPNIGAITGVMRTPVYTLTSTTLQVQFQMIPLVGALSATVRIGRIGVRKYFAS